jgi:prepilin-type N-terminal cleavage/methylation domain-containing protein
MTKGTRKGFTLIELMIAIVIFVSFLVLVSNSFIGIIRAQVSANETRQMYSELRNFVDFVNGEMREGTVDYFCYNQVFLKSLDFNSPLLVRCVDAGGLTIDAGNNLRTISKDGLSSSVIKFTPGVVDTSGGLVTPGIIEIQKFTVDSNGAWVPESGNETFKQFAFGNLSVKNLHFDIYPKADPASNSSDLSTQLQPMVEMSMDVASTNPSVNFDLQFQTMITSRAK